MSASPPLRSNQSAVILTALGLETQAVLRHLSAISTESISGTVFFKGQFEGWDVSVAETGAGNVAAATIATRACEYYKPTVAFFIGVAGGVKDVAVGDIVVATKVYGYESGKDRASGFNSRPTLLTSAHALEQRARSIRQIGQWKLRLSADLTHSGPVLHVGPIAAGEKVVASKRAATAKLIQNLYGDAIAIEMEGRGFLEGVHLNHPVQGCVVRGISDLLSGKTNADRSGSQERAADAATAVAFEILSGFENDPATKQGTNKDSVPEISALKAMASSLIDAGTPPSMSMLFADAKSTVRDALDLAERIDRTVVEIDKSKTGALRSLISPLVSTEERRHLILGPPGSGKTHALWRVGVDLLKQGNVIPLFLPAGQVHTWDDLADMLKQAAPQLHLDDVLRDPRICILIDGWSEFASGEHAREKQRTLRSLQNTRIIANGKIANVSDTPFKTWTLEPFTPQQVTDVLTTSQPGEPLPQSTVVDLLQLPLLLAIYVNVASPTGATGELLRQFHRHVTRGYPESFTGALVDAVAKVALSGNRSYGSLVSFLESSASARGVSEPLKLFQRLGTIVERNGQALPIHDLYWSWLVGVGLLNKQSEEASDQLHTRESYRLALQSGSHPKEADIEINISKDIILAANFSGFLPRSTNSNKVNSAINGLLENTNLAVKNRGALAALAKGNSMHLKQALNTLSALTSANLYISDWPNSLNPDVLHSQRGILADWIGSEGTSTVLDAIGKLGGAEWVPWLEQVASEGKVKYVTSLGIALACEARIPDWGRPYLDDLLRNTPWALDGATARRCNRELAKYIARNYERLIETVIVPNSSGWINLNEALVSCGEDSEFELLLKKFHSMSVRSQELLGYAVVVRGEPWIAEFQKIAFAKPSGHQHHKLEEELSLYIEDEIARSWIRNDHYEIGWRVLIARHGSLMLPELIAALPETFDEQVNIPSLAVMKFLPKAPPFLLMELLKRVRGGMHPKVVQDMFNVMATVDMNGYPGFVDFVCHHINDIPTYHLSQVLHLYMEWRQKGKSAFVALMEDGAIEFSQLIARHSVSKWDAHGTPRILSFLPDLAISLVLGQLNNNHEKCALILEALKPVKAYNANLLDFMLKTSKVTSLIPSVFQNVFDTFPTSELQRCLGSSLIDQGTLMWRLGATSNPLHRPVHAVLIGRLMTGPVDLHHSRYVASMLRAHTAEDIDQLLRNEMGAAEENWLWLVREVELARGERLINEAGELLYSH